MPAFAADFLLDTARAGRLAGSVTLKSLPGIKVILSQAAALPYAAYRIGGAASPKRYFDGIAPLRSSISS